MSLLSAAREAGTWSPGATFQGKIYTAAPSSGLTLHHNQDPQGKGSVTRLLVPVPSVLGQVWRPTGQKGEAQAKGEEEARILRLL